MSQHHKITIEFVVSEADILECHENLRTANFGDLTFDYDLARSTKDALVDLLQTYLYDYDNGPMLEGQFKVIADEPTDDEIEP